MVQERMNIGSVIVHEKVVSNPPYPDKELHTHATTGLPKLLAHTGYAPGTLAAFPDDLAECVGEWNAQQWSAWRNALEQCWQRYQPAADNIGLALKFARFAWAVELWWLVRNALAAVLEHGGERADVWAWLAACESNCGRQDEAVGCLMHALTLDRAEPQISEWIRDLSPLWARQHELTATARSGPVLRLEPLGPQHAQALLWQYRDPQIASWAATEPLHDLDAVHAWMAREAAQPGKRSFAVMHVDDGFVGAVSYVGDGEAAFIHYWIGCDHQGKGYAVPAVAMMCEQARCEGNTVLFTSCHPSNERSLRVLARSGFNGMVMPPLTAGDKELNFFVCQLAKQKVVLEFERLSGLLEWLGWPLALALAVPVVKAA